MTERAHPLHDRSVGEIAARLAGASSVFRRFGIDFCCQGHVSLKDAANHHSFDLDELKTALDALDPSAPQPVPQETDALIDHIQTCYHDVHRQQLPELVTVSGIGVARVMRLLQCRWWFRALARPALPGAAGH